ncbi:glycerol-3-phosphate dehydrogenase/oxidase [Nonomuraea gerenzanensis]|uniref:Uncharacterized protein n=1 Tax=Nonomuraea gerenzanensis TaxID=93944 RepID=A0A1M4DVU5_9ACTN|nr:glycerol-3-phosphate dehydrogenase/oxidase [Nonomuraea gerenzanensis]UBU13036.1 glycerol-3-phosphate dehydrogenase/oxidase [Nonomuraea gerenzanensis]SBO90678.1 hypothetical protein BN4615_P192 [Nonomuraea gerenzanensis]
MAQNDGVQNVVSSINDFLQQAVDRQDVPQDIRDRAERLRANLSQLSGGSSAMSM